jgi:hypothetical protein
MFGMAAIEEVAGLIVDILHLCGWVDEGQLRYHLIAVTLPYISTSKHPDSCPVAGIFALAATT